MAAAAFFGHALLGLGPGAAFFCVIIAPKSFVVLLSLFSAFFWLVALLLTSALLRGFVPLADSQRAHAGALLAAVAIEEAARYGVWQLHKRTLALLHDMSTASGHTFTPVDELYLAVGWGYGQAVVHVLIMFGSLVPLTAGHGTLYAATCPQMSVFLVAALNSLGLGATLVALSVVALDAWSRGSSNSSSRGGGGSMMLLAKAYAPLMHAGAALLTLGSMQPGGCVKAVTAQLALGLVNTTYAAALAWRRGSVSNRIAVGLGQGGGVFDANGDIGLGAVAAPPPAAAGVFANSTQPAAAGVAVEESPGRSPPPETRLRGEAATVVSPSSRLVSGGSAANTSSLRSRGAALQQQLQGGTAAAGDGALL